MNNKEELLRNNLLSIGSINIKKNVGDIWGQFNREISTKAIYEAMNQFAQQQAVAFSELLNFYYVRIGENIYEARPRQFKNISNFYTTEQLYDTFINQTK